MHGPPFAADAVMSPEEFSLLRDAIAQRTGLCYPDSARAQLERRLRDRLAALSLRTFSEYYHHLRFSPVAPAEWDELADALTTNETYFFREGYQLRAFKNELLPALAERGRARRALSIWSAGCSTGEEVYTIAILLHESRLFEGWDVRVFGSDISRRCVTFARAGVYREASFRTTTPEQRRAYFVERPDGVHVQDRIRERCQFGQLNVLDEPRSRIIGEVDAVFCRNVLIYFDAPARLRAIDAFYQRLRPGGVLLLGHAESLINVTTAFELLHLRGDLVYRRPAARL